MDTRATATAIEEKEQGQGQTYSLLSMLLSEYVY